MCSPDLLWFLQVFLLYPQDSGTMRLSGCTQALEVIKFFFNRIRGTPVETTYTNFLQLVPPALVVIFLLYFSYTFYIDYFKPSQGLDRTLRRISGTLASMKEGDADLRKIAAQDRRHDASPTTSQPQNLTAGETSERAQRTHYVTSRGIAQCNVRVLLTSDAPLFSFFFVFDQTKLSSAPPFSVLSPTPWPVITLSCSRARKGRISAAGASLSRRQSSQAGIGRPIHRLSRRAVRR